MQLLLSNSAPCCHAWCETLLGSVSWRRSEKTKHTTERWILPMILCFCVNQPNISSFSTCPCKFRGGIWGEMILISSHHFLCVSLFPIRDEELQTRARRSVPAPLVHLQQEGRQDETGQRDERLRGGGRPAGWRRWGEEMKQMFWLSLYLLCFDIVSVFCWKTLQGHFSPTVILYHQKTNWTYISAMRVWNNRNHLWETFV